VRPAKRPYVRDRVENAAKIREERVWKELSGLFSEPESRGPLVAGPGRSGKPDFGLPSRTGSGAAGRTLGALMTIPPEPIEAL